VQAEPAWWGAAACGMPRWGHAGGMQEIGALMHALMPNLHVQTFTGQCAAGVRTNAGGDEQARPGAGRGHKVSESAAELDRKPQRQRAARTGPHHVRLAAATQTRTGLCLCHAPQW
jgi:hypothetical protein